MSTWWKWSATSCGATPGSSTIPASTPAGCRSTRPSNAPRLPSATTIRTGGGNGQKMTIPNQLAVLPIRNIVVFPGTVMPLNVGRPKSKALLDDVMPGEKLIGVVTQRNPDVEDPGFDDLHHVGVACVILKLFKLPDGNQSIIVHGLVRFRLKSITSTEPFATGEIEVQGQRFARDRMLVFQPGRPVELTPYEKHARQSLEQEIRRPPIDKPVVVHAEAPSGGG